MDDEQLEQLIREHLKDFQKEDPRNAGLVNEALENLDTQEVEDLLTWWKNQDKSWAFALHSYLFWLWRKRIIEYAIFENFYSLINPVVSKSWSMPIVITNGIDDPVFEGGFVERKFSIFQFNFSPANRKLLVSSQEHPQFEGESIDLEILLDFLSFLLDKSGSGFLGFRQIISRKTRSSTNAVTATMMGPEIQTLPDFDFELIEKALERVKELKEDSGLSLTELLHVRHRAILDSNLESKLITLWSTIEAQWGEESKQDRLLTEDERKKVKDSISFLPQDKYSKVIDQISRLKSKTKNEKIIEGIEKLECVQGHDVGKSVGEIFRFRSRFAHGGAMNPGEQRKVQSYISFMFEIIDELITGKFSKYGIEF